MKAALIGARGVLDGVCGQFADEQDCLVEDGTWSQNATGEVAGVGYLVGSSGEGPVLGPGDQRFGHGRPRYARPPGPPLLSVRAFQRVVDRACNPHDCADPSSDHTGAVSQWAQL